MYLLRKEFPLHYTSCGVTLEPHAAQPFREDSVR